MKDLFKFKKFNIHQDRCAMKVCTDACILGASVLIGKNVRRILDIGSGTGLLSLMVAQRCSAEIVGVEVNEQAAHQSKENINASFAKDRITIYHQSIQQFARETADRYDLIISNPPFFSNNFLSDNRDYNIACHSELLSLKELLGVSIHLLEEHGNMVFMLPSYEMSKLIKHAKQSDFHPVYIKTISHQAASGIIREICCFRRGHLNSEELREEIAIKNNQDNYTPEFQRLLKEYYIIF
jgi:tRNA1Val (adenine37-N6)-methyltransferase